MQHPWMLDAALLCIKLEYKVHLYAPLQLLKCLIYDVHDQIDGSHDYINEFLFHSMKYTCMDV